MKNEEWRWGLGWHCLVNVRQSLIKCSTDSERSWVRLWFVVERNSKHIIRFYNEELWSLRSGTRCWNPFRVIQNIHFLSLLCKHTVVLLFLFSLFYLDFTVISSWVLFSILFYTYILSLFYICMPLISSWVSFFLKTNKNVKKWSTSI